MSRGIQKLYDDYEEYVTLCSFLGIDPFPIRRESNNDITFAEHLETILDDEQASSPQEVYQRFK